MKMFWPLILMGISSEFARIAGARCATKKAALNVTAAVFPSADSLLTFIIFRECELKLIDVKNIDNVINTAQLFF